MDDDAEALKTLMPILMPYAMKKREKAIKEGTRLVHYASADTAMKILTKQEFWLRDSRCMNDFSEVQNGLNKIQAFLGEIARRQAFITAVDACHAGIGEEIIQKFDSWRPFFWSNTYIMCMSAHKDDEDDYGRLSMWRAYGRQAGGAAIVLNAPWEENISGFNVFLSPVRYAHSIDDDMSDIIANLTAARNIVTNIPRDRVLNGLFNMFAMAACCLKHPGFCEEEEWRLIHLPKTWKSDYVVREQVAIDGVPQYIYRLPFAEAVRAGYTGANPLKLINRVIVGPSSFPGPIAEQLFYTLGEMGFADPNKVLSVSHIPLRM